MEPAEIGPPISVIHIVESGSLDGIPGGLGTQTQTLDQTMSIPNSILTFSGEFTVRSSNIEIKAGENSFTMAVLPQILDSVENNTGQFRSGDSKNPASSDPAGSTEWGSAIPPISVDSGNFTAVQFASYLSPLNALNAFQPRGAMGTNITNNVFYYTVNQSYGLQGSDCTFAGGYGGFNVPGYGDSDATFNPAMSMAVEAQQPAVADAPYFLSLIQGAKGRKMWYMNFSEGETVQDNATAFGWQWTYPSTKTIQGEYNDWMVLVSPSSNGTRFYTLTDPGFGFTLGSWGSINFTGTFPAPGNLGAIDPCPKREEKWVTYAHYYGLESMGNNVLTMSSFVRNTNLYNTIVTPMDLNTIPIISVFGAFQFKTNAQGKTEKVSFLPVVSNLHTPQLMFVEKALLQYGQAAEGASLHWDVCKPSDYFNSGMTRLHDKTCPIPSCYFMAIVNTNLDLPVDRMLSNFAVPSWWGTNLTTGEYNPLQTVGFETFASNASWSIAEAPGIFTLGTNAFFPGQSSGADATGPADQIPINMMQLFPGLMNINNAVEVPPHGEIAWRAPAAGGIPSFIAPNQNCQLQGIAGNNWNFARADCYWAGMQMWSMPHTYFLCARTACDLSFFPYPEYNSTVGYENEMSIHPQLRNYPWMMAGPYGQLYNSCPNPFYSNPQTSGYFDPLITSSLWVLGQWGTGPLIGRDYTQVSSSQTNPLQQGCGIPGHASNGTLLVGSVLGGADYVGTLGDAIGTVNMFVPPPHLGVYPSFRVPNLPTNPYGPDNTSLVGGIWSASTEDTFSFIHVPNDERFDFEGHHISPVGLCYGQGFYNTYCGAANTVGKPFKLPADGPLPPEAPYDVSNMGANWDVDWQDSFLNSCLFIANRRLMDAGTRTKPYFFPINNSADSAMNSLFTDPEKPYTPRIGHFLVPLAKQYSALISAGWPTPPHTIYYNTPSPLVKNNPRRDNYDNFAIVSNQPTVPCTMMDLAHGAQAAYGTCCWPKNHIATEGNVSMFFNFPPFTDNLSAPDQPQEYSAVPSAQSYQYLPYGPNSCMNTCTQVNPNGGLFTYYGAETQYRCVPMTFGTSDFPPSAYVVPSDSTRYGYQCYGTAADPINPTSYGNSKVFSHSFLQNFPEGHAQSPRQLTTYHMACIMQRSTDPQAKQTFDEPLIFKHTFTIPPGSYSVPEILILLNQQLVTPDSDGNFPFLRYVDFTSGNYICTVCDYEDEFNQPWLGMDNLARYPNEKESARFSLGNRFGAACEEHDEGRVCKIFAGPPVRKLCGSNALQFELNAQGYLVLSNTASQISLGSTTNPLPVGSSLVSGVNSIFQTRNSYERVGSDPYQMGACGQTINGQQLNLDKAFYNNTTALHPIDYQLLLNPCPYLPAADNLVGCGTWPACTVYTAGLGPNQTFGLTPAALNTPARGVLNETEVVLYNYSSQWVVQNGGSLTNPFAASQNPIVVNGLPTTTYSWPSNPAATFQSHINYKYFDQAVNSSLIGSTFNIYSHVNIPGETQVQVLSIADVRNPKEVSFWKNLGFSPNQLEILRPKYAYVELAEGFVYDVHTKTHLFSPDAFVISNQSPYLNVSYADINIATIPDTTVNIYSEASVLAYLDTLPFYQHTLASHDLESITQNNFSPWYAGTDNGVNLPGATFKPLAYDFTSTIFQKKEITSFTCNNPMYLTSPSSFENSTTAGVPSSTSAGPFPSGNFPLDFLAAMQTSNGLVKDKMFHLMPYFKVAGAPCSAILPAVTRFLPMQMGEIAFSQFLIHGGIPVSTEDRIRYEQLVGGSYLHMSAVFGNNPYNQHTHIALPVSRSMNGGQFQIDMQDITPNTILNPSNFHQFDVLDGKEPLFESMYYQRFHSYHPPQPNTDYSSSAAYLSIAAVLDPTSGVFGMDDANPNDRLYYPDPLRNMIVNKNQKAPKVSVNEQNLSAHDWLSENYMAQLNVVAGSTWTTFAPTEAWGFQCHETRDDSGIGGGPGFDNYFHGDLKSTSDPRDAQIFERGPKEPAARLINIWCGSHLGFCGINSSEYGTPYPSNYGAQYVLTATPGAQLPATHAYGNASFLVQHMAQTFSALPQYSSTGALLPGTYEMYKSDMFDAKQLWWHLTTPGNPSTMMSATTIPTWNPPNFQNYTHSSYLTSCEFASTIAGADYYVNDLIRWGQLVFNTTLANNNCHELALAMTSDMAKIFQTEYYPDPQAVLNFLCNDTSTRRAVMQAPVAGRVHCDKICPIRINVSPNSYYDGLCSQPTLPELRAKNANGKYSAQISLFEEQRHCKIAKFCTNIPQFNPFINLGPIFPLEQSLPLQQNVFQQTSRGRTPLQTFNYLTDLESQNLIDASDPVQITTWTNGALLGIETPQDIPIVAAGVFFLRFEGIRFSINAMSNINGRSGNLIPVSIQANIDGGVFSWNSSCPFIVPAQEFDSFSYTLQTTDGKPISGILSSRLFATFSPTNAPTPTQLAFLNSQTLEEIHGQGVGQTTTAPSGGTLGNITTANPVNPALTSNPKRAKFAAAPYSGYSTPAFNAYSPAEPVYKPLNRK
jgi:hypothetical protein